MLHLVIVAPFAVGSDVSLLILMLGSCNTCDYSCSNHMYYMNYSIEFVIVGPVILDVIVIIDQSDVAPPTVTSVWSTAAHAILKMMSLSVMVNMKSH